MSIGNQQNMERVRQLMNTAEKVQLGGNLTEAVEIDFTSEATGKHYAGVIVFKKPNVMDYMRIGGVKSEIFRMAGVRDLNLVDAPIKITAHVVATLKVVVNKAPAFLINQKTGEIDLESVDDTDLLYHIFDKYEDWENSFRKPSGEEPTGTSETTATTENVATSEVLG